MMCYNASGPTGCISTLSALTTTNLSEGFVMADAIISRKEARAQGLKHFFTGIPCKRGHIDKRSVAGHWCASCHREDQSKRYKANPEPHNAGCGAWARKNPEKRAAIQAKSLARMKADPVRAEQHRQALAEYRAANAEKRAAYNAEYNRLNADRVRAHFKEFYRNHPERYAAYCRKRQAAQLRRTPAWLTSADLDAMTAFYEEAGRLTRETGIPHEVDHIIPLQGRMVSGLHVPSNLRIMTRSANRSKANKHDD